MDTVTTPPPTTDTPDSKARLAEHLRRMVDEADQLLKSAVSTGDQKVDEARIRLEHQLQSLRLQLADLEESTLQRARRAMGTAHQTVQSHPYGAMGIAAAAGLLIGLLASRR